ncbi:hypothetical protein SEPCBS119000_003478 [Sporothrix epigloea]|uniref:Vps72/YL1 C-terminal domain-containing protein n=1 Tax=Sporothrix epigloea TaxID=1892477 RepID=A0ABP0DLW5_9PEZI
MANPHSHSDLSNPSDSDDSEGDKSDTGSPPKAVEWLATGRAKRATAGNRMKSLIASIAASSDQFNSGAGAGADADDLELLFAEDGDDSGWSLDEHQDGSDDDGEEAENEDEDEDEDGADGASKRGAGRQRHASRGGDDDDDMHMDTSDDDDEDDQEGGAGVDELAGERELEQKEHEKRRKAQKRKAQAAIPARFRKKVRIHQPHEPTGKATPGSDRSTPSRVATPAPQAYQPPPPRKKKKSERTSWLPTAAEAPIRASSRATTRISKEQLYQQMAERERRRERQLLIMAKKAARDEANKKPPMTQAQRLAEAAVVEEANSRSLNTWEEAEKQREADRAAKLAAMYNRTLEGPVVTFWSGIVELTAEGLLQSHMGRMVAMEEKAPRKKRLTAAEKAAAAELAAAELAATQKAVSVEEVEGKEKTKELSLQDSKESEFTSADGGASNDVAANRNDALNQPQDVAAHATEAPIPHPQPQSAAVQVEFAIESHIAPPIPLKGDTVSARPAANVPAPLTAPVIASGNVLVAKNTPEATDVAMNDAPPSAEGQPSVTELPPIPSDRNISPITADPTAILQRAPKAAESQAAKTTTPIVPASNQQAFLPGEQAQSTVLPVASPSVPTPVHTATLAGNPMAPPPLPHPSVAVTAPYSVSGQQGASTSRASGTLGDSVATASSGFLPPGAGITTPDHDAQAAESAKTETEWMPKANAVDGNTANGTAADTAAALPADSRITRSCIVLQNFDEDAVEDKQVQMQILFGRRMSKIPKPSHAPLCNITGHRSRYRDVETGLTFYNAFAYKQIRKLCNGEMRWSSLAGAWVGSGTPIPAAAGVPDGFVDPTKLPARETAADLAAANSKDGAEQDDKQPGTSKASGESEKDVTPADSALDKPKIEPAEAHSTAPAAPVASATSPVAEAAPDADKGQQSVAGASPTAADDSPLTSSTSAAASVLGKDAVALAPAPVAPPASVPAETAALPAAAVVSSHAGATEQPASAEISASLVMKGDVTPAPNL